MSAVAPQLPAHDVDAIEAGTTATGAVKGRGGGRGGGRGHPARG